MIFLLTTTTSLFTKHFVYLVVSSISIYISVFKKLSRACTHARLDKAKSA